MEIKEVFGTEKLSYDEFISKAGKSKFVDLNDGQYVSVNKFNDLNTQVETLNSSLTQRDTDLADLQKKLSEAGVDSEKLNSLSGDLESLQKKYQEDIESYKAQIEAQKYEFAVKEFANNFDFSSKAAKKEFVREMIDAKLPMNDNDIMGAKDFHKKYAEDNADSFMKKNSDDKKPHFTQPTGDQGSNGKKVSLTDMMKAKNLNPDKSIDF